MQFRTILAPVDFSEASKKGVMFARALAHRFRSKLQLIYVIEPPVLPEWGYAHLTVRDEKLKQAAQEKLIDLAIECHLPFELTKHSIIATGDADQRICEAANSIQADLIVIASHGLAHLRHAVVGSTAERVVRYAPCPVLTVRDSVLHKEGCSGELDKIKEVIAPTDFSDRSTDALPYAQALGEQFKAPITLVHVVPAQLIAQLSLLGMVLDEQRLLKETKKSLPVFGSGQFGPAVQFKAVVLNGSPVREICKLARRSPGALIVLASHGQTGLKHLLMGSVAERVVRHAPCPVLVIKEALKLESNESTLAKAE